MLRASRVIVVGLALVLVVAVATSGATSSGATARAAACANDGTALSKLSAKTVRAAVVCLVNQERTRFGLPTVSENAQLDAAAQGHVNDMLKHDYFSHEAPGAGSSTPPQRIAATGYKWSTWGENLAAGYPTALAAMTAWMSDFGHCANVLFPAFGDIGIGFVNKPLAKFASAPALWTQDFGLQSGKQPPSTNQKPSQSCPHGF